MKKQTHLHLGLRESRFSANFHFWVNRFFKTTRKYRNGWLSDYSTLCENRSWLWNIANTLHYKSKVWTRLTEWMICDLKNLSIQTLWIVPTYKVNAMEPTGRKRIIKHLYITCSSVSKHPMMHLTNDHSIVFLVSFVMFWSVNLILKKVKDCVSKHLIVSYSSDC